MKKLSSLCLATLALASTTAGAASFTAGNVAVLRCDGFSTSGNTGSLVEYTPGGSLVQTIPLPGMVFGSTLNLAHDITLSADGALVIIPGYATTITPAYGVEGSGANTNNRVVASVKWDGSVSYYTNSAFADRVATRGVTGDGFGNFWGIITGGARWLTVTNPTASVSINNTGSRAGAIFNGQLYASTSGTVNSVGSGLPTASASYSAYLSSVPNVNVYSFALPAGAPVTGSRAYVGDYTSTTALYVYSYNSGWSLGWTLTLSVNPAHIAVDYNHASPLIYFTAPVANNSLLVITDPGANASPTATTLATAPSGGIFRGVTMAPTQPSLPVCSVNPASPTANPGDTVSFGPVSTTGANPNAYTWKANYGSGKVTLANGATGHGSSVISGATTANLTIANVAAGDLGSYYVEANNNGGTTECGPGILSFYPSCLSTTLASRTNVAASTATFSVASGVSGCTTPLTYSWFKNGSGPLTDGVTGSGSTISGATTATLTISGVQDGDASGAPGAPGTSGSTASYSVTVVDGNNTPNSSSAVLTVLDLPVFTTPPANQNKATGATANFTVAASGGSIFYSWYKSPSGSPLTDGASGNGSTISGSGTAHLVISGVQLGDAGTYYSVAGNLAGSTQSDPATLTVGVVPVVSALNYSTNLPGSDAVFAATVTAGTGPLTYTWKHNTTTLANDGVHIFGADTATLGITNVAVDDRRLYSLTVANAYGSTTVSAQLYVILSTSMPNDVPDLIVYDPFDYPTGPNPAVSFYSWESLISVYNRITGEPAFWINTGAGLFSAVSAVDENNVYGNPDGSGSSLCRNGGALPAGTAGGRFPYPGLDSSTRNHWLFSSSACNNHLHFGGVPSGCAYFSFLFWGDQGSVVNNGTYDVAAGFTSGNSDSSGNNANNFAFALGTKADVSPGENNPGNVDGPGGWRFGVFKGGGVSLSSSSVNGQWSSLHCWRGHPYLIVGCYKINSGTNLVGGSITNDDVLSLWVEPPISSFGAAENNLPPPDAGGMLTNWSANAAISEFAIRATLNTSPFSKRIADLRIGKTWASVTHPHHPTVNIADGPSAVTLSWPANDTWARDAQGDKYGYQLESSPDMVTWTQFSGASYSPVGDNFTVSVDKSPSAQFFRLVYPPRTGAYWQY